MMVVSVCLFEWLSCYFIDISNGCRVTGDSNSNLNGNLNGDINGNRNGSICLFEVVYCVWQWWWT
jgi:hypothetical protein